MRVMVIVKATSNSEAGRMPGEELLVEMGKFNEELVKAGVMLAGEGLRPSSQGVRIKFQGKKRLGCVIRRFPREPLPLESLGLRPSEQKFAYLSGGLLLILGDTCQGKSTTIASMLDEINRIRSGHMTIPMTVPTTTILTSPFPKFAAACLLNNRLAPASGDSLLNFGVSGSVDHKGLC